jgi:hypothetical protein
MEGGEVQCRALLTLGRTMLYNMLTHEQVLLRFAILRGRGKANAGMYIKPGTNGLKGLSPPAYAGPSLLAARSLVWVGGGVKGVFA